ncbi:MAG: sugar ABC transporter ATP-binding protein [Alphaproteobacteria bacterium]|nr:sugar ABC transporter ATP-binding protein [Alphaproteobacteria bacterium]
MSTDVSLLSARGIVKSFGGVHALSGIDLELKRGEVHALLGENGAGKSTVIKVLAGVHRPDAGTVTIGGRALPAGFGPADVAAAGLRFVHQDLGLVDSLPVYENMAFQTGFICHAGIIDRKACVAAAATALARLGATIDPRRTVGELAHADKTIVALARAMQGEAKVVVLDEVTASLPSPDVARIHGAVRTAKAHGTAFLYVTHRLEEVFSLCDRASVLADGRNVANCEVPAVGMGDIVRWITGGDTLPRHAAAASAIDEPSHLTARNLAGGEIDEPVDIDLRPGEIVGVTGIRGSGYDRLCRWLAGIEPCPGGEILVDGKRMNGDPRRARDAGVDIVLGDRTLAAFSDLTVRENLFPAALTGGRRRESNRSADTLARFGVRPRHASERIMATLSGGNQQKVIFARALEHLPKVIVLIDPTAGVDIGARRELHDLVRAAAQAGTAILYGSSDFEEIADIADSAVVLRNGASARKLAADELDWNTLMRIAQDPSSCPSALREL